MNKHKKVKVIDFYPVEKNKLNKENCFFFYDCEILEGKALNVGDELNIYNDETNTYWNGLLDKKERGKNYVYIY